MQRVKSSMRAPGHSSSLPFPKAPPEHWDRLLRLCKEAGNPVEIFRRVSSGAGRKGR